MPFAEEDYIPLRALQHYVFCPRQFALIHTEREWAENALTTMGRLEHTRVDTAPGATIGTLRTARSVSLVCHRLGIRGVADVVEYEIAAGAGMRPDEGRPAAFSRITPVEYKHGRPQGHGRMADAVQLCAQALCLEEMHGVAIPAACLFYRAVRRRVNIELDAPLREATERAILGARTLFTDGALPPAVRTPACGACSLLDICLPLPAGASASAYIETTALRLMDDL